jgi:hypothetical protein
LSVFFWKSLDFNTTQTFSQANDFRRERNHFSISHQSRIESQKKGIKNKSFVKGLFTISFDKEE